jgi:hypothetical protein
MTTMYEWRQERDRQTPTGSEVDRYLGDADCAMCGAENDETHELCGGCQAQRDN